MCRNDILAEGEEPGSNVLHLEATNGPLILSTRFRGLFSIHGRRAAVGIVIGVTALVVIEAGHPSRV